MLLTNALEADDRVWKEMNTLAREGYHIFLIAWDRKGIYPKRVETKNVAILRFRRKAGFGKGLKSSVDFIAFFRFIIMGAFNKKIDFIHCHDLDTLGIGFQL